MTRYLLRSPFVAAFIVAAAGLLAAVRARTPGLPVNPRWSIQSSRSRDFWDPRRRPERPDLSRINVIRFMTETDYPPFNFAGPDGNPQGFNVDLARLICEELKLTCTVQMRRFETMVQRAELQPGGRGDRLDRGDAGHARKGRLHRSLLPHAGALRGAARCRRRRPLPEQLEGKKVAVVAGTAHEAYLKALFTEAELAPIRTPTRARGAQGAARSICCSATPSRSRSGSTAPIRRIAAPFAAAPTSTAAISAKASASRSERGNDTIRLALNWALFRVWEQGRFTDLWLRYFPISPF